MEPSGTTGLGAGAPGGAFPSAREQRLQATFVELADKLVADFDLMDLLSFLCERCAELLEAAEVGLLVADPDETLRVVASSSERMHMLELFEVQNAEGPCLDAYRKGDEVVNEPLTADGRWPSFAARARSIGLEAVHALPLRYDGQVVGVLNVFDEKARTLGEPEKKLARALAGIAVFSILRARVLRHATEHAGRLQHALDSRVVVEQAKGVLSERLGIDVASAFQLLRRYSRNTNERMAVVARRLVERELTADALVAGARGHDPRRSRPPDSGK